ncbi:hypothetical protein [Vagococcus carniphilus]|uniref:hypothetical protein n=1 Tax=Vagococcus carniphilus TaxID=218144 RepID=UPI0028917B85|nr:hypothetical protein [Vagococcus carniphilus]MDT2814784.1 hypothetical protein [Vagococcus carniphilus]MDT2864817.1 hypothetical protein [Vagococcus carniphilus]
MIDINNLKWDTDLKRILLGDNYDETNPIKNILMGKLNQYYMDDKSDYYNYKKGHLENYQIVEDFFENVTNHKDTGYKDVMNSFWTTYKCLLQIEYPDVFRPLGSLAKKDKQPLRKSTKDTAQPVHIGYPPLNSIIHDKYIDYYKHYNKEHFPKLKLEIEDNQKKITWIEFLLINYERFDKVNEKMDELKRFAKLTHTIGNITVVPVGFNGGRNSYDYWDYGLMKLRKFLITLDSWNNYVEKYHMEPFLNSEHIPLFFLNDNLKEGKLELPQETERVIKSLKIINDSIELRGRKMFSFIS